MIYEVEAERLYAALGQTLLRWDKAREFFRLCVATNRLLLHGNRK